MTSSFNNPWLQPPPDLIPPQPQLQLEHEFGFPTSSSDGSMQQTPARFSNSFQYPPTQFLSSNPTSNADAWRHGSHGNSNVYNPQNQSTIPSYPAHGIYGSAKLTGQSQAHSLPLLNRSPAEIQGRSYHNNLTSYNQQNAISPTPLTATSLSAQQRQPGFSSGISSSSFSGAPYLSTSPGPMQESFTLPHPANSHPNFIAQAHSNPPSRGNSVSVHQGSKGKRQRQHIEEGRDEDNDAELVSEQKEGAKAKPPGACQRCKGLKVRCEFRTDTDPCKRCLNGGHDCVIPGRKKRRVPPKREHLLNQIREQAAQIQGLMSQLESMHIKPNSGPQKQDSGSVPSSSPVDLHSPTLSPSSTHDSNPYFNDMNTNPGANPNASDPQTHKVVEDWISKARESLADFGGLIGVGGAGFPKGYFVDEDPEDLESSGDEAYVEYDDDDADGGSDPRGDEYEIAVEDEDGEDITAFTRDEDSDRARGLRTRLSASSLGTNVGGPKKKHTESITKLSTLPSEAAPFGLMATLSLKRDRVTKANSYDETTDEKSENGLGVAGPDFFKSNPVSDPMKSPALTLPPQTPHILSRGIVTIEEAEKLFQIYFKLMNLSVSLLDPDLYTAQKTCYRSPFLFTVVCAVASRYYTERPDLYAQTMHYAQLAAGTALISGPKCVEMCQGYILLSLYPVPARRWEEDRSWLYLGLAIRIARDLNLHHPSTAKPRNENHAREILNRTRIWLNCFNLDRSTGSQYGKAPVIPNNDYIANHCEDWWKSSPYNMRNFDIHISCYNAELRVMSDFMKQIYSDPDHPTGLNKEIDIEQLAKETDDQLVNLENKWFSVLDETDLNDLQNCFRIGLLKLAYSYARLIALSYGFQHAFKNKSGDENAFLHRCLRAATDVVNTVVMTLGTPEPRIHLRHGPEAQSVFVTFASAFLVKLLQPKYANYLNLEQRVEIHRLVQSVIDLLGSPEVALDDRHGPKLYARFLSGLLATPMARIDLPSPSRSTKSLPRRKHKSSARPSRSSESPHTTSNHHSPSSSSSLSPPPTTFGFDQVQFTGEESSHASASTAIDPQNALGMDMSLSDFFQPPLPFDTEMLQSFQSLTDPSAWQDISLPGFNWMSQFSNSDHKNDTMMFDSTAYGSSS